LYCDSAQVCVNLLETKKDQYCNIINVNVREWHEVITIEDQRMNIKLNTGAEVSIIPLTLFNKINEQFNIRPTNVMLVIPR
jgi:small nuclear ribonucleoprotein (snRNP)-like protein